jgi:hypothetical protein
MLLLLLYPGLALVQALAPPAPPPTPSAPHTPTPSAPSVTAAPTQKAPTAPAENVVPPLAAPTQKAPTAPAENVIPPLAAAVQSDTSPDPAPAAVQSDTTSPGPACSTGAESVMPAGVSFSLPAQHGLPTQQQWDHTQQHTEPEPSKSMRESPKKTSLKKMSEEIRKIGREIIDRKAKTQRKDHVDEMQGFIEDAERKAAEHARNDEEDMPARKNEEELSKMDKLIAKAMEIMDTCPIQDID